MLQAVGAWIWANIKPEQHRDLPDLEYQNACTILDLQLVLDAIALPLKE